MTADAGAKPDPRRWAAMYTILMTNFMNLMDVTIVNVALPSIQRDLGISDSGLEWIVAGFILTFALGLLPMGRTGDIFGRKRLFLIGVAGFTGASLLCGLAPSGGFLIAARVMQGASAAIMSPQTLAITQELFDADERGSAFALFGLTASLAAVSGPAIGGLLIAADIMGAGWRPIFLINLPIGLLALWLGARLIPDIPGRGELRQDWVGIVLATLALFCLIFPMVEGRTFGWPAWVFAMLCAAPVLAAAFALWERRQARAALPELLPVALMTNRAYVTGLVMTMALFSTMPAFFFTFALFLQKGFGFTPLHSGLTTMPFPVGIFAASLISTRLGARWPVPRIFAGLVLVFMAFVGVWAVVRQSGDLASGDFILPLVVAGFGVGTTIAPLFQTTLASVPMRDAGSASGALQALQQTGGAIGVSAIGLLFFGSLAAAGGGGHAAYRTAMAVAMAYPFAAVALVFLLGMTRTARPS